MVILMPNNSVCVCVGVVTKRFWSPVLGRFVTRVYKTSLYYGIGNNYIKDL